MDNREVLSHNRILVRKLIGKKAAHLIIHDSLGLVKLSELEMGDNGEEVGTDKTIIDLASLLEAR